MGFFTPNAGAAVKFENVGDTITGRISGALSERQATYNGQPRTTKKGKPVMEIVVPMIDTNGNERTLYASSWRMQRAIQDAVMVSGAKDVEQGGVLTVTFSGHEQGEGAQPAKAFTAQYQAPGAEAPAAPAAAPQQYAQSQQYAQPQQQAAPQQYGQQSQAPQQYGQPSQAYPQAAAGQVYGNYQAPAYAAAPAAAPAPLTN